MHRPVTDWDRVARKDDPTSVEGRIFSALQHLISLRRDCDAFAGQEVAIIDTDNRHVFGYLRRHQAGQVLVLANFSERTQTVPANVARTHGLGYDFHDLVTGENIALLSDVILEPYRFVWLVTAS